VLGGYSVGASGMGIFGSPGPQLFYATFTVASDASSVEILVGWRWAYVGTHISGARTWTLSCSFRLKRLFYANWKSCKFFALLFTSKGG